MSSRREPTRPPSDGADEHMRMEAALRESQRFLGAVLGALPTRIAVLDEHGTLVAVNRAWERSTGPDLIPSRPGLGSSYLGACDAAGHAGSAEAGEVAAGLRAVLAGERGDLAREIPIDGGRRWLALRATPFDGAGPARVVLTLDDVTARKRAEQALYESMHRTELILEAAVDGIITIDERGIIESVNPAAERIFGYAAEEIVGRKINLLMPPPYRDEHDRYLESYLSTGEAKIIGIGREVEGRRRDGSVFPMDLAVSEVRIGDRRTFLGTVRDISERKLLEEQFRQAQKMEAIGRLAGGVAHDFNTLLGSITGYSELLLERIGDDEKLRRPAEQVRRAAERGADLTRQLLAFSRHQVLKPQVLDLNRVLAEMDDMLRRLIGEDIELSYQLNLAPATVEADAGQLEQLVLNLVVNAADAVTGGGRIEIVTESVDVDEGHSQHDALPAAGAYVRLSVTDDGQGMDEATRARVFEPFFTTKEKGKGTGLGLATVYGIVRQSGGGVTVESAPGRGSAFRVYLPRATRVGPARDDAETAVPAERRGHETVLLVEDDPTFRELLAEVLESRGYRVLEAGEGAAARDLAEAHEGRIDLLVSDMVMPGVSGAELARALVAERPGLRVLLMSGYTDEALEDRGALAPGGVSFLQKPFGTDELLRAVRETLDREASG